MVSDAIFQWKCCSGRVEAWNLKMVKKRIQVEDDHADIWSVWYPKVWQELVI